jgi:hypothetical protein
MLMKEIDEALGSVALLWEADLRISLTAGTTTDCVGSSGALEVVDACPVSTMEGEVPGQLIDETLDSLWPGGVRSQG